MPDAGSRGLQLRAGGLERLLRGVQKRTWREAPSERLDGTESLDGQRRERRGTGPNRDAPDSGKAPADTATRLLLRPVRALERLAHRDRQHFPGAVALQHLSGAGLDAT